MKLSLVLFFIGWATGFIGPMEPTSAKMDPTGNAFIYRPLDTIDLATVREEYREASQNEEATKALYQALTGVGKDDNTVLVAYRGAVTTMMADYAQGIKDKKTLFKEGRELLEHAIETEPDNVEIRCIRLSVQENVPKITGYHKEIEADKQFILENCASMTDKGAKAFVKRYVSQSEAFTEAEKRMI
ncbi:hypothetical protein RQM65_08005 [Pricia sp. S334]|uniref:Tetratricopeptide repeat protein n=1 Tax=Pricia mediterranea TaxID=3076079 RepID=A0ABU3L4E1_9FLAO|nr:hypothetical protein [Pricia sp. S334]MDT7828604.1 hypothetical protein [Pricia sp. S334]